MARQMSYQVRGSIHVDTIISDTVVVISDHLFEAAYHVQITGPDKSQYFPFAYWASRILFDLPSQISSMPRISCQNPHKIKNLLYAAKKGLKNPMIFFFISESSLNHITVVFNHIYIVYEKKKHELVEII